MEIGFTIPVPNSVEVHFCSGSTCVCVPFASITSIPDDSDPLAEEESITVNFERSGNLSASSDVPCTIAWEFPSTILRFQIPPADPITRAQIRPTCTVTIVFPSVPACTDTWVFASNRRSDRSEKMSVIWESSCVLNSLCFRGTRVSFEIRVSPEAVFMATVPVIPVTSISCVAFFIQLVSCGLIRVVADMLALIFPWSL